MEWELLHCCFLHQPDLHSDSSMDFNSHNLIIEQMINDFFHFLYFQSGVLCFACSVLDETMDLACLNFNLLPFEMDSAITYLLIIQVI